jgi:hypothetical protein
MLLEPWLRVALLVGIWGLLAGMLAAGIARWFQWMRDQDRLDRED